jgi:hypothetical protein
MAKKNAEIVKLQDDYDLILSGFVELLEQSRRLTARSVNAIMTATYWEIGRRIVEVEQKGEERAEYGASLLKKLATDLTNRFGRGFSRQNLQQMRMFYLFWQTCQTLSGKSADTQISKFSLAEVAQRFPLPWSHYVLLLSRKNENARKFYEDEALRGGWTVRQLIRKLSDF